MVLRPVTLHDAAFVSQVLHLQTATPILAFMSTACLNKYPLFQVPAELDVRCRSGSGMRCIVLLGRTTLTIASSASIKVRIQLEASFCQV